MEMRCQPGGSAAASCVAQAGDVARFVNISPPASASVLEDIADFTIGRSERQNRFPGREILVQLARNIDFVVPDEQEVVRLLHPTESFILGKKSLDRNCGTLRFKQSPVRRGLNVADDSNVQPFADFGSKGGKRLDQRTGLRGFIDRAGVRYDDFTVQPWTGLKTCENVRIKAIRNQLELGRALSRVSQPHLVQGTGSHSDNMI